MIVSVPGMKATGRRTMALTEFVDIYPSLSEVCGLELPRQPMDGYSFAPLLDEPGLPWTRAAFSQFPRRGFDEDKIVMGTSMRTERFRYTEWKHLKTGKILARELYDHDNDPQENINVIDVPRYAAFLGKLEKMMTQGWQGALPR
ncbi:MAG: hypothetical protein GY940_40595 [bacterium]|nr:hypothetical protein [bacterium]